jgi:thiosulfate reductase cytochrome b subunit
MRLEHPAVVRFSHWTAAIAVVVLVMSGLEIFAAFPSFGSKVPQHDLLALPDAVRLGGWLGGALQWHVTFAALLVAAGSIYAVCQTGSGNYRQVLFAASDAPGVWPMARHYFLRGPKSPERDT